ncbi:hypothetical protein Scep_014940 [Stephania cephalantha]|uniref:Phosphoinositide phospholipase C n=1 Tax=Stephania cephalantha TaxID=152367 RepID=A0AAP0J278_9MAGN
MGTLASPKQSYIVCLCFKRRFKAAVAEAPDEIKSLFNHHSSEQNGIMTVDNLYKFLIEIQGEEDTNATKDDAQSVIDNLNSFFIKNLNPFHHHRQKGLNFEAFFRYLFSDLNPPISPKVHHDMRAPLSHYFLYTGHNSYLTGNQLSSDCSDGPIIKALKGGVRVIELDLWPNSDKDDVDVLHGRTLTTPVKLIKCLRAIKEHAFSASPYPVIVTLEDHLTPHLQNKVAKMVTETFGETLFYPESGSLEEFPSPEELKNRIILSTKPPKEYLKAKNSQGKEKSSDDYKWGKEDSDLEDKQKIQGDSDSSSSDSDSDDGENRKFQSEVSEYKRLIGIQAKKRKGKLSETLKVDSNQVGRISLSEQKLEKAASSHGSELVRFTQKNLLRIYPKGTRFNSSNYDPLVGWTHGAQMVAFNMQGYGKKLWWMQGMFRSNGGCGYMKKPDILMKSDSDNMVFDPEASLPVKKILKVKVYMGDGWRFDFSPTYFDSYSPPDFYTRIGIAGVPADSVMKKTRILEDNWVPVWDEEFKFPLTVPELALLRIEVHEYDISEKDDFGGQTCLPVSELKLGIRAVPLFDRKGNKLKSVKLLMRFDLFTQKNLLRIYPKSTRFDSSNYDHLLGWTHGAQMVAFNMQDVVYVLELEYFIAQLFVHKEPANALQN